MLDFFRNHKRLMMLMLVLVIVPGLGFVGIQGFRGFFDESANVASVNGHKITRAEFDNAVRQQLDQARQILGSRFDSKLFDTPERRQQLLDSLIQQRALADEAQREHLTASDEAVRRALLADPVVSSLRKPDGSIDLDRYKELLAMQGMTPEQYDERVRYGLAIDQIPDSIQASAFTPKSMAEQLAKLAEQQRTVQSLVLHPADYASKVQPTDAQLAAYYDAHRAEFATPQTATIQYVVFSPATLSASIAPSDADAKKYYDENIARYTTPREIRVSQILISSPATASAADDAKAKAKAESVLAEVKAHPDQFADIAKKDSQDPGSASKGGDLGWSTGGVLTGDKAFDTAALGLKGKNAISGIVRSSFGYHVIMLTDEKPSVVKPFADVKDDIMKELKAQQATKAFSDGSDGFTSTVYEQAKSLQPAADKYKLKIETATVTDKPSRTLPPDSPLNNPKFLAAVFANDAVKDHNNTQAIDAGNNTLISARVTDYKPAATPPLASIKDAVRNKYVAEQALELARKDGTAKLADFQKSKSTAGFGPETKVSRTDAQGVPPPALAAVFKVDASKLPAYVGVDLGDAGYGIYRVNAVVPGAPIDPARLAAAQQQLAQISAQEDIEAYLAGLRARSKVKMYGSLEGKQGDGS
ncbi:peptidyl-prolyl cis-trans isomerase D [Trinickia symbiotica]|uniref:Periplasmic chaperone PpiD n=1 Tax=Trinickia symbiotica TaxID=863227 RepID=A0A2N7X008_9BURK|nr:SurA N-terminal domain-containing protein [Trinickia symbiotica]PMS34944.1 peptidylprolyl isomerase [Trinickia symbiotica]PPK45174.1 peptidyl-prolyl cis-trans isomerase D [Trinickia symbiotica]